MDFESKILARILIPFVLLLIVGILFWVRKRNKKTFSLAFESCLDVPAKHIYWNGNVRPRIIYCNRFGQQFIVQGKRGEYFKIAVMRRYWSGFGRPPIAFSGWTKRIAADELIEAMSLRIGPPHEELEERLAKGCN